VEGERGSRRSGYPAAGLHYLTALVLRSVIREFQVIAPKVPSPSVRRNERRYPEMCINTKFSLGVPTILLSERYFLDMFSTHNSVKPRRLDDEMRPFVRLD